VNRVERGRSSGAAGSCPPSLRSHRAGDSWLTGGRRTA